MNYPAIIIVSIVTLFASMVWYMLFGKELVRLNPTAYTGVKRPKPTDLLIEIFRNIILALVIGYIAHIGRITTIPSAFMLAIILWIGFPLILLSGSVIHEKVPIKLALIHSGDWLLKLLLITTLLTLWR